MPSLMPTFAEIWLFANHLMEYAPHAFDNDSMRSSLFSPQGNDSKITERCASYRRLIHTFGLHGAPLPWVYADAKAMENKLVLINAVDAGPWLKISFVNYEHEKVPIDLKVTLPLSGRLSATRYGGGATVEEATRQTTIQANPEAHFQETLDPGETVEYLIEKAQSKQKA